MNTIRRIVLVMMICAITPMFLYANVDKPIAVFNFEKSSYQLGEPITVQETSYSKSGNKITQKEWMTIVGGKRKTSPNIHTLLKGIQPGSVEVFLRVKDEKKVWSNWTSHKIEVKTAKQLKIINFKTEYDSYDIGEKLQFTYNYDNPNDLAITSQRWRYKNIKTGASVISGKPKYFSKAGTYEVSLELQDEWGNWSNKAACTVKVSEQKIKRNGKYLFTRGKQGDLLEGYIDKDYNTFEELEDVQVTDIPGTLIVSNSPESISSSGILYKDTCEGTGRLVVHHLNNTTHSKKLMVIASTPENQPVKLTVKNLAIKGPHKDILKTGQAVVREYFETKPEKTYTITPGALTSIYDSSQIKKWENEEVISGMFDFESDGPITWTVVSMDVESPLAYLSKLQILEKDMHIRGTFDVMERQYRINITQLKNPGKITIGGGTDEWLVGKDALTGKSVVNRGNYGLPINMYLESTEDMGIIINARGGSYLGAIKWNKNKVFDTPSEEVLSDKKVAALIGMVKAGTTTEWTYMLPNGSSAPVLFGFIPAHLWEE